MTILNTQKNEFERFEINFFYIFHKIQMLKTIFELRWLKIKKIFDRTLYPQISSRKAMTKGQIFVHITRLYISVYRVNVSVFEHFSYFLLITRDEITVALL